MKKTLKKILIDQVMTSAEAAVFLNVDPSRVRQLLITKRIEGVKRDNIWLLDREEVEGVVLVRRPRNKEVVPHID